MDKDLSTPTISTIIQSLNFVRCRCKAQLHLQSRMRPVWFQNLGHLETSPARRVLYFLNLFMLTE